MVCEESGIPAVVVVTEVFENLARTAATAKGFGGLRIHALPHPMESRPEAEVRAIARERFRAIVRLLAEDA
jgi:hypothetical protein